MASIKRKTKNGTIESVAHRLEELVIANSGVNNFEEILKILILKIDSEKSNYQLKSKDFAEINAILSDLIKVYDLTLGSGNSICLIESHFRTCIEEISSILLSEEDYRVLDAFFEIVTSKTSKGNKGQFFTPRLITEFSVKLLGIPENGNVCDPASGSGGFIYSALKYAKEKKVKFTPWAFDFDEEAVKICKVLVKLMGGDPRNVICANSLKIENINLLNSIDSGANSFAIEDVMRLRLRKFSGFDAIYTNPPFAGELRERELLDSYELSSNKESIERDVLFIERCLNLLRVGGRLAIVLPHNKLAGSTWGYAREWLMKRAKITDIVSLPRCTFLPHTHQKAYIIFAEKREKALRTIPHDNIKMHISEKDFKNTSGEYVFHNTKSSLWASVDHDFAEILNNKNVEANHGNFI